MLRDTYAEINLNHLEYNIATLKEAADKPLMAVVKADGYGHGAPQVAKKAWECGIKWMAVSNPDEALEIREICPEARILVLSSVLDKAPSSISILKFLRSVTIPSIPFSTSLFWSVSSILK